MLMSLPRPRAMVMDVETVMRELLETDTGVTRDMVKDAPPKYEDLEEQPPKYDASTMSDSHDRNSDNYEGENNSDASVNKPLTAQCDQ